MTPVFIACPETLDLVPTGVDADTLDELAPINSLLDCPSCSHDHEWTAAEAVLGPRDPASVG